MLHHHCIAFVLLMLAFDDPVSPREAFVQTVAPMAQASQIETTVPASVTIAQAILESDWGTSQLARTHHNYFGIKAPGGGYCVYGSLFESVDDHGHFLRDNPRYHAAFAATDPREFARRIARAGYAEDGAYARKLSAIIEGLGLTRYDAARCYNW